MTEQRRVSRPSTINIEVITGDSAARSFEAKPLPWRARNDLGDEVVQQYLNALNEGMRQIGEGTDAKLIGKLMEAMIDYDKLFTISYPQGSVEYFHELTFTQMMEVLNAALEVNLLGRQRYMIDPNLTAPTQEKTTPSNGASTDGQKTTSSDDSSSPALTLVE